MSGYYFDHDVEGCHTINTKIVNYLNKNYPDGLKQLVKNADDWEYEIDGGKYVVTYGMDGGFRFLTWIEFEGEGFYFTTGVIHFRP